MHEGEPTTIVIQ